MKLQITPDQCFCCFGNGIVYEFIYYKSVPYGNRCAKCSFRGFNRRFGCTEQCYAVHCQKPFRKDEKDGFWQISQTVDYQQFIKMLKNHG